MGVARMYMYGTMMFSQEASASVRSVCDDLEPVMLLDLSLYTSSRKEAIVVPFLDGNTESSPQGVRKQQ